MYIDNLPPELILYIVSFFRTARDFRALALTCNTTARLLCSSDVQLQFQARLLYEWPTYIYVVHCKTALREWVYFTWQLWQLETHKHHTNITVFGLQADYTYNECFTTTTPPNWKLPFVFVDPMSDRHFPQLWYDVYEKKIHSKPQHNQCRFNSIVPIFWHAVTNIN